MLDVNNLKEDITNLMKDLACERPVFHSEADFQHALSWRIHEASPDGCVRLEYPFRTEGICVDIWLPDIRVAVELKYPTQQLELECEGESFALRFGTRYDGQYHFLKDIQRLELLSERGYAQAGCAVLLTNDPLYWEPSARLRGLDKAFYLHDGLRKEGELDWPERATPGAKKGLEKSIRLRGSYDLQWQNYADVGSGNYRRFRYLMVQTD